MNYFYCPDLDPENPLLDEEESKHCIRVLRYRSGHIIHVLDGKGHEFTGQIVDQNPKATRFKIIEDKRFPRQDFSIHLAVAPTKNLDRMEWMVEKITEIGVDRISFIACQNSERTILKTDRILKKAINAMKQSGNHFLPIITGIEPFASFLENIESGQVSMIGHAELGRSHSIVSTMPKSSKYLVLIGPEGDFSETELQLALSKGFAPVTLGPNRLRTETAAMVACTQLYALNI